MCISSSFIERNKSIHEPFYFVKDLFTFDKTSLLVYNPLTMKNAKKEYVYTTIHFVADDAIKAYLARKAKETDRTISAYLRQVVKREIEREQKAANGQE